MIWEQNSTHRSRRNSFVQRLHDRLAFQAAMLHVYRDLLTCVDHAASSGHSETPARIKVAAFFADEHRHQRLLEAAIVRGGGAPAPSFPFVGGAARSSREALDAALVMELVASDAWDELIDGAGDLGEQGLAFKFAGARKLGQAHLDQLRTWIRKGFTSSPALRMTSQEHK